MKIDLPRQSGLQQTSAQVFGWRVCRYLGAALLAKGNDGVKILHNIRPGQAHG
jgi:hypothetical protein